MNATKSVPRGGKSLSTTLMWTQCLVLVGASVHPCLGVQWNVVRESIGQKICLSDSGMPIIGTPTSCKSRGDTAPKEVEEASLAAFEEAHPLFVTLPGVFSLLPDALNAVRSPCSTHPESPRPNRRTWIVGRSNSDQHSSEMNAFFVCWSRGSRRYSPPKMSSARDVQDSYL